MAKLKADFWQNAAWVLFVCLFNILAAQDPKQLPCCVRSPLCGVGFFRCSAVMVKQPEASRPYWDISLFK